MKIKEITIDDKKYNNPLLFPFIIVCMASIMYCVAFHDERNKNETLKKELIELKKLKNVKKC